ncbi:MAG: type II secretion system GspH family protein [Pirellulales bacterium]|nr:type II secretion system GspH family protein [Pirellulales bacterium]
MPASRRSGFTLIELSIVLVIIGLLAGAILLGRDLIRASEFRKMYSQQQEFASAINAFRTKYNCLPGDCPNATRFFGSIAPGGPSVFCPPEESLPDVPTCDGSGNGVIEEVPSPALPYYADETLLLWQHLADAGLIAGLYSGTYYEGFTARVRVGLNCPPMHSNRFCWRITAQAGGLLFYDPAWTKQHVLLMWPQRVLAVPPTAAPSGISVLSGSEALGYDTKYDDGLPDHGAIRASHGYYSGPQCASVTPGGTYAYFGTATSNDCLLAHGLGL